MKPVIIIAIVFVVLFALLPTVSIAFGESIPNWVRNIFIWYGEEQIEEGEGGVYAIMAKTEVKQSEQYYKVTYFGQTNNFSERLTTNHENYDCFKEQANKYTSEIYRELYFMLNSSEEERKKVESKLIKQYNSPCNNIS